jgi:hypothetical protein
MIHPNNTLNSTRNSTSSFFVWKKIAYLLRNFFYGEGFIYKKPLSKPKTLTVNSKPTARDLPLSQRSPLVSLELRKNHPLLLKYYSNFNRRLLKYEKKKSH